VLRGESPPARAHHSPYCRNGHLKTAESWDQDRGRCRICNSREVTKREFNLTTHCPRGHFYAVYGYLNALGRRRCSRCFPPKTRTALPDRPHSAGPLSGTRPVRKS
jgi:hypothetical protein